jgi:hypothetical protein
MDLYFCDDTATDECLIESVWIQARRLRYDVPAQADEFYFRIGAVWLTSTPLLLAQWPV